MFIVFIMCNMRTILLSSSQLQVGLNKQLYLYLYLSFNLRKNAIHCFVF